MSGLLKRDIVQRLLSVNILVGIDVGVSTAIGIVVGISIGIAVDIAINRNPGNVAYMAHSKKFT